MYYVAMVATIVFVTIVIYINSNDTPGGFGGRMA